MQRKWEVRFSGTGGQGIIRSAVILAQAALYDGFDAVQSQSYGPESRGGSTKGEVVIDDEIIYYPKVNLPNLVVCLSQEAYKKYGADIRENGILIVDSSICKDDNKVPENVKVYEFPIIETAREEIQNELSANVLSLGIVTGLTEIVSEQSMIAALTETFKKNILESNLKAFALGLKIAQTAKN
ncbi:MAG: 2-oxoacid:acceptor oxidoreductase family protein [Clostridia bacterium]|jgi:2-oxoglutarate ferredoxin oxidoreductase subunit gamma|nr:2-oxoacid:acceptor oxidoreductase family protein [Clostridia bacterium]